MKTVYLKVLELLQTVGALKFIDLDKGQIDNYEMRPNVVFPAVLVNIDLPDIEDEDERTQRVWGRVVIRAAFSYTGETSGVTDVAKRDASLQYFDVVSDIFSALQGYSDDQIGLISRRSVKNEFRSDGLKVVQIGFEVGYNERA